jgi:tetratricopeptide (TPR) repeat protein
MSMEEEAQYLTHVEQFKDDLDKVNRDGNLKFYYEYHLDESHASMPHISINNSIRLLYKDWIVPQSVYDLGVDSVILHYQNLSSFFGYKVRSPEHIYRSLGKKYLENKDYDSALKAFNANTKIYPKIASSWYYLGEAYEGINDYSNALINYEKAYNIAKTTFDRNIIQYQGKFMETKMKVEK